MLSCITYRMCLVYRMCSLVYHIECVLLPLVSGSADFADFGAGPERSASGVGTVFLSVYLSISIPTYICYARMCVCVCI